MTPANANLIANRCVDCHNGTGHPIGVSTIGPFKLSITYSCATCGHQWAVARQVPGFVTTWTGSSQPRSH